jgi:hypothetical protein
MGKKFDRNELLNALDRVGLVAVANQETLEIPEQSAQMGVPPEANSAGTVFYVALECTCDEGMACSQRSSGVQESQHIYRIPPPSPKIVGPSGLDVGRPPLTPPP